MGERASSRPRARPAGQGRQEGSDAARELTTGTTQLRTMSNTHPEFDFKPEMPRRLDHGIGIVGAGGVVNYAHLPAYAQAGFKVVAITDKVRERAEQTAAAHKVSKIYSTVEELVHDPEIEIVDIAVYAWETVGIGEQAIQAGKHILCQKPLSEEYARA